MLYYKFIQNEITYKEFIEGLNTGDYIDTLMRVLNFSKYKELAEYLGVSENLVARGKREGIPEKWLMYISLTEGIPLFYLMQNEFQEGDPNSYRFVPIRNVELECCPDGEIHIRSKLFNPIFVPRTKVIAYGVKDITQLVWFTNNSPSMEPTLKIKDTVCCELNSGFLGNGGIYVIGLDCAYTLCRLQKLNSGYRVFFDNPKMVEHEVSQEIQILGRVLYSIHSAT